MAKSNGSTSIVALPSVSSSLHALPHATTMQSVHIHQHMYAKRAAESEAKLQKAISLNASAVSQGQQLYYQPPSPCPSTSSDDSSIPDDSSIHITITKSRFA